MQYGSKSVLEELKLHYKYGGIITQIILVNVVLFLSGWAIELIEWLAALPTDLITGSIDKWTLLPSDLGDLIIKPYTLFTYQFLHNGFFHILFNMWVLYFFGKMLTGFISEKKVLPLYLMGGIAGGIFFLLLYNLMPAFDGQYSMLVGASGSIMAIVFAAATLTPDMEIRLFFALKIKLKYLAAILVIFNIFTIKSGANAGGNFAHLGGAAFGFLFIYLIQNHGIDLSKPWIKAFDYLGGLFEKKNFPRVTYVNPNKSKNVVNSANSEITQEKVNAILDKIAQDGYDSLSKAEKEYLFKASKE